MYLLKYIKSSILVLIAFLSLFADASVINYGIFKEMDVTPHIEHKYITYNTENYTTLCWADIKVTNSFSNGTNSSHDEYAIILLSSTDIPTDLLKHESIIDNVEYYDDGNTKKSRVFNFTTTNMTENGIVIEYTTILCGSGPVLTKDYIDLNLKKRFEIRVAPASKMDTLRQYFPSTNGTIPDTPNIGNIKKIIEEPLAEIERNLEKPAQANFHPNEDFRGLYEIIEDEMKDVTDSEEVDEDPVVGSTKNKNSAGTKNSSDENVADSDELSEQVDIFTSTYSNEETLNTIEENFTTESNLIGNDHVLTSANFNCSSGNSSKHGLNLSLINVQIFNLFNNNVSSEIIEKLRNNSGNLSYNHDNFTNSYLLSPFLNTSMMPLNGDKIKVGNNFLDQLVSIGFSNNTTKWCKYVNCD